jgi:DNA-binding NarL/FixJ family response regulator
MKVSVLLVDDDAMTRTWIRDALDGTEFYVAGEAAGVGEALDLWERRRPDIGLVDYRLDDGRGTQVVAELRRRGLTTPVLVMTAHAEQGLNELARTSGAQGTVLKTGRPAELLAALRDLHAGRSGFDAKHPRLPEQTLLSPRERELLGLVAAGRTNLEIAGELRISAETVKTILSRAFGKLGARRRAEAVARAKELGVL